jgi:endogenous inhibitor of DNA gyrase (YacG/DUF329 family)
MTTPKSAGSACAICGKPVAHDYRPFCSRRCADVDLQRWLSGAYVVPGRTDDEAEPAPSPTEDQA